MKSSRDVIVFNIVGYFVVGVIALLCLAPFIMIISGSLSEEEQIVRHGFSLLPRGFSGRAYGIIMRAPDDVGRAYGVSIFVTTVATLSSLFFSSMAAFVLSRREFRPRNRLSLYIYFTTMFTGGLVPLYILVVRYLQLKNTVWGLILPLMLSPWHIILLRTFMTSIPYEIMESAKMDGAGYFRMYAQLVIPLSTAGLATIGLFTALLYWNDWFHAMLFVDTPRLYPLQFYLYKMLNSMKYLDTISGRAGVPLPHMPAETLKLAMVVIATGPIFLLYPFVQRYFVKGITVGAVKG
jgi:putative aldouronate transport system permease protein